MIVLARIDIANQIIPYLLESSKISVEKGRVVLSWKCGDRDFKKFWATPQGSFYPVFSNKMSCGGTYTTVITQLVNWCKDKPVLPIATWEYWFSPSISMKHSEIILPLLQESDYPKERMCEWCKRTDVRMGWWTLGNRSGLGCLQACDKINVARAKLIDRASSQK